MFDHAVRGREAVNQLLLLKQGNRSVSDFSGSYRILAGETGSNQAVVQGIFFKTVGRIKG